MSSNKIIAVTVWSANDPLIKVYTLPYLRLILSMFPSVSYYLQTFDKGSPVQAPKHDNGISYIHASFSSSFIGKVIQYVRTIIKLVLLARNKDVAAVHAFCTPGAMIGYIVSALSGKPLLIDSLEPHAECMVESGTWSRESLYFKMLFFFEKLSVKNAKAIICVTPTMPSYVKEKYDYEIKDLYFKPACVDLRSFEVAANNTGNLKRELGISNEIICAYVGKFGDLYLEDEVFEFFAECYAYWGGRFKVLLLTNQSDEYLNKKSVESNFPFGNIIKKFVSPVEVPLYLSTASFAISPLKPIPTRRYCTPIKTGEYWAAGLPVVITRDISIDSDIIEQKNIGYVLKEFTINEYKNACLTIESLLQDRQLHSKVKDVAKEYRSFELAERAYAGAFKQLNISR
ncbi:hypothetical protein [Rufibacter immobilis]|uniref:hypothetical protein n=1 Tax=Rufibacter immobilis TaxID=1348778 RepID=UPI0035EFB750